MISFIPSWLLLVSVLSIFASAIGGYYLHQHLVFWSALSQSMTDKSFIIKMILCWGPLVAAVIWFLYEVICSLGWL